MRVFVTIFLLFAGALNAQDVTRWVSIINDKNFKMVEFYASNREQTSWGPNWFGNAFLQAYSEVDLNLDDGSGYCIWDLRAVFADGREVTRMGVNVCEEPTWRVY